MTSYTRRHSSSAPRTHPIRLLILVNIHESGKLLADWLTSLTFPKGDDLFLADYKTISIRGLLDSLVWVGRRGLVSVPWRGASPVGLACYILVPVGLPCVCGTPSSQLA